MSKRHRLPDRELVFIQSLQYHGFRRTDRRKGLKRRKGYIITATWKEDAVGTDFYVKMPGDMRLFPVQVTQRGVRIFKKFRNPSPDEFASFVRRSNHRVRQKQKRCRRHGIAFVLVRDFVGDQTNPQIAWGDIKALRYSIAHLKRWL